MKEVMTAQMWSTTKGPCSSQWVKWAHSWFRTAQSAKQSYKQPAPTFVSESPGKSHTLICLYTIDIFHVIQSCFYIVILNYIRGKGKQKELDKAKFCKDVPYFV